MLTKGRFFPHSFDSKQRGAVSPPGGTDIPGSRLERAV